MMKNLFLLPALAILLSACVVAPNEPSSAPVETKPTVIQQEQPQGPLDDESTGSETDVIDAPPAEDIIIEAPDVTEPETTEPPVLEEDPNAFTQSGMASWYGKRFHGRKTANGERFDMHAMTAAHPKLPMHSYVEVTNLKTDETVIVRINDRGPFAKKRIIDLSYAAAKKIGIVQSGVARVKIRQVTKAHFDAAHGE